MQSNLKLSGLVLAIAAINHSAHAYDTTRWNYDSTYGNIYEQTDGSESLNFSNNKYESRSVREIQNSATVFSKTPEQTGSIRIDPWWMGGSYQTYNYQETRKGIVNNFTTIDDDNLTDSSTQISRSQYKTSQITQSGIVTRDAHTEQQIDSNGNLIGSKRRTDDTSFKFQADDINTNPTAYSRINEQSNITTQFNDQQAKSYESSFSRKNNEIRNSVAYDESGNLIKSNGKNFLQEVDESSYSTKQTQYRAGKSALSNESESSSTDHEQTSNLYYKKDKNGSLVLGKNGQPIVLAANQDANGKLAQQSQYLQQWDVDGGNTYNYITAPLFSKVTDTTYSSSDKTSYYQPTEVLKSVNEEKRSYKKLTTDIMDGFQSVDQSTSNAKQTNYNPDIASNELDYEGQRTQSSNVKYRTFKTNDNGELLTANGKPVQDYVYNDAQQSSIQQTTYKSGKLNGTLKSLTQAASRQGSKDYSDGFKATYQETYNNSAQYQQNLAKNIEVARTLNEKNSFNAKDKVITDVTSTVIKAGTVAVDVNGINVMNKPLQNFTDANGQKKFYVVLGYDNEGNEIRSEVKADINKAKLNETAQYMGSIQTSEKVSQGETVAYNKTSQTSDNHTVTNTDDGFVAYDRDTTFSNTTLFTVGKHELDYQSQTSSKSDEYDRNYKLDRQGNPIIENGKLVVNNVEHNVVERAKTIKDYQEGQVKAYETSETTKANLSITDAKDSFVSTDNRTSSLSDVQYNKGKSDKYSTTTLNATSQQTGRSYQRDEDAGLILVNGQPVVESTTQITSSSSIAGNQYQSGQALKNDLTLKSSSNAVVKNLLNKTTETLTTNQESTAQQYRQGQVLDRTLVNKTQARSQLTNADNSARDYQTSSLSEQKNYQTKLGLLATQKTAQTLKQETVESLISKNPQGSVTAENTIQRGSEITLNADSSQIIKGYGSEKAKNAQGFTTQITDSETINTNKFGLSESTDRLRTQAVTQADGKVEKVSDARKESVSQIALTHKTEKDGKASESSTVISASGITTTGQIKAAGGVDASGKTISNVANGTNNTDAANVGQLKATLVSAQSYADNAYQRVNHRLDNVEKSAYRGVAISLAAQQAVPNIKPGNVAVFGGVGHYQGESAVSFGVTSLLDNGRTSISAAFGVANSEVGGRVGVAYVFGE